MRIFFLFFFSIAITATGCGDSGNDGGSGGTAGVGGTGGTAGIGGAGGQGGTGGTIATCTTPAEILRCDGVVLNIAHRGGRRIRPEHTLLAYEQALLDGADVLELDIHETSDGVLVVMHDSTIDRTTNGTGAIKEMTFEQLRTFDAGYWFTTDGGTTYPYRDMGVVVPSLEEVLTTFSDSPFVIEIKQAEPSIVDDFVAMVRARGVVDQIIGAAFSDEVLAELRAAVPEMATSFSESEVVTFFALSSNPEGMDPEYVPPGEFLQVPPTRGPLEVLHARFIPVAHELGLKVQVWTINDADQMRTLIEDYGVDGILTDDPPLLTQIIDETGTGLPD